MKPNSSNVRRTSVKVVAFIQAHTLGLVWTGRRSRHGQAVHRGPHQFHVMTVGPVHRQTHRNALGFGQQATLDAPPLPRSVGLGPVFPPAQGRFGHGAVHTQPTPVQPLQFVIAFQSHPPQLQEHPSGNPFLKAQVGGGPGADARGVQAPSTGSQCAARRRCRWRKCGREPGADRRPKGGCSPAGEATEPTPPTARRISERNWWWGWPRWTGQHAWVGMAWGLSLWSSPQSRRNPRFPPATRLQSSISY